MSNILKFGADCPSCGTFMHPIKCEVTGFVYWPECSCRPVWGVSLCEELSTNPSLEEFNAWCDKWNPSPEGAA